MIVEATVSPLPGIPALRGPHELAWWYMLDAIFADAYHANVEVLQLSLPTAELIPEVAIRAELTARCHGGSGRAVARLGAQRQVPEEAGRVYTLDFGWTAAGPLRRLPKNEPGGCRLHAQVCTYTLKSRLWGIPMRCASLFDRPDLADRGGFAMRCDFVADRDPSAYYRLGTWCRR